MAGVPKGNLTYGYVSAFSFCLFPHFWMCFALFCFANSDLGSDYLFLLGENSRGLVKPLPSYCPHHHFSKQLNTSSSQHLPLCINSSGTEWGFLSDCLTSREIFSSGDLIKAQTRAVFKKKKYYNHFLLEFHLWLQDSKWRNFSRLCVIIILILDTPYFLMYISLMQSWDFFAFLLLFY